MAFSALSAFTRGVKGRPPIPLRFDCKVTKEKGVFFIIIIFNLTVQDKVLKKCFLWSRMSGIVESFVKNPVRTKIL